jgi:hypothetical protein
MDGENAARGVAGLVLVAAALTVAGPGVPVAGAHTTGDAAASQHALAHEASAELERRQARRWARMAPAERRAAVRRERRSSRRYARGTAGEPSRVGKWTAAPFDLPAVAIHTVVLPTGKVLFWGPPAEGPGGTVSSLPNETRAWLWDPRDGTGSGAFENVNPPLIDPDGAGPQDEIIAPLYCAGQSFLPNGDVLLTGGNLIWPDTYDDDGYEDFAGLNRAYIFDVSAEEWVEQPQMNQGRWYPTQVLLGDGRTVILGGYNEDEPGGVNNRDLEVFEPPAPGEDQGEFVMGGETDFWRSLYPHMFTMPDGRVFLAGPILGNSHLIDVDADGSFGFTGFNPASMDRYGGTAVLEPKGPGGSDTITQIGGAPFPDGEGNAPATATTESFTVPGTSWAPGANLNEPRYYPNTLQLPDRSLVTVGGGSGRTPELGNYTTPDDHATRRVELYDPATDEWTLGPAQQRDRTYHSTAVLLPDGRVWSAGDDYHNPAPGTADDGEIYSPPYLFKGKRPGISRTAKRLDWGDAFGIKAKRGELPTIRNAVLVAPSATTHSTDMGQRVVPLRVKRRFGERGLDVVSPPSANVAPPGPYMLFGLSGRGVPTVAKWVRMDANAPDAPRLAQMGRG